MAAPQADALTPALLWQATARLVGEQATKQDRFGIAVSGGPDSMALLLLARAAFSGRVAAATVDHGLRHASAAEADLVARHCADRAIPHAILRPATAIVGSVQASARAARYALLEDWRAAAGIDWLMTAHHADDQLETLLLRLNRASGVGGLASIRRRQGRVLRPLLAVRHDDLVAYVAAAGIAAVDDPSNRDERFDRARLRRRIAGQDWLDVTAAAASADHLADADAALDWATSRLLTERMTSDAGGILLDIVDVPAELRRRLMVAALGALDPHRAAPRGTAIDRAIAALDSGASAMLGDIRVSAVVRDQWRFAVMPARRRAPLD